MKQDLAEHIGRWRGAISRSDGVRYKLLAEAIIDDIDAGRLRPGVRLPARRDLAYRLKVAVNTVSNAYIELERRGYVSSHVGSGTYVQIPSSNSELPTWHLNDEPGRTIEMAMCYPCDLTQDEQVVKTTLSELSRSYRHSVSASCVPLIGTQRNREAGQFWLKRLGVEAPPDRIIVTNGNSQALTLALSALTEAGDIVVTDRLTNNTLISLANVLHFRLLGIAIDEDGIVPDDFRRLCASNPVKALVTTPSYNNPNCTVLPVGRRKAIAEIAREYNVALVENDPFTPLLDSKVKPLTSFAPKIGYYMTTLSKSAARLRVGYLTVPEHHFSKVVARLRATSWMASQIPAEIATRWIGSGQIDELVSAQREELRRRQSMLMDILGHFGVRNCPTGILAWLQLPETWRSNEFVSRAQQEGIDLTNSEPFVVGHAPAPEAIRLAVGMVNTEATLRRALMVLRDLLHHRSTASRSAQYI